MADSINRIMPAAVTPERTTVTRRERDDEGRHGGQGRERQPPNSGSPGPSQEDGHAAKDKQKGNRLDRNA